MNEEETRRFERRLPHEPEKVWRALTEAKELAGWFPAKVDNDIAPQDDESENENNMSFEDNDTGEALEGKVLEIDPPRLLAYTMGEETLRFELSPIPEGCLLVLTTTVQVQVQVQVQAHVAANDDGVETFRCAA